MKTGSINTLQSGMAAPRWACPPRVGTSRGSREAGVLLPSRACCSEPRSHYLGWVGGRAGDEIYVFKKMELKAFNPKS